MAQRKARVGTTIREDLHGRFKLLMARRGDRVTKMQDVVDKGAERWLDHEEKKDATRQTSSAA